MISKFLSPRRVAVVGASNDPGKLRGKLLHVLKSSGFDGAIYPVNPGYEMIQGLPAFPDLKSLPEPADLALIAAPGAAVPAIILEAVASGVGAAVILSSGVDGEALKAAIGDSGLRVMGPNTEGYYKVGGIAVTFAAVVEDALAEMAAEATAEAVGRAAPRPGRPVSIVSQSGGIGFSLYGRGRRENLDFHAVITTGNEFDVECLDAVDDLIEEGRSGVILMYIEGLKTPARFAATAARAADRGIPLIVLKIGHSEAGQRAAVSHTAHLAGADTAYDAIFERYGVLRVFDPEQMLAAAAAFSRFPRGPVARVAVVTTSGGAGAWAADLCGLAGLAVPLLSAPLQGEISALIPGFGAPDNPVDVTGQAVEDGGKTLVEVLKVLEKSAEIDGVIVNMGLAKPGRVQGLEDVLKPLFATARKPILFHSHILPSDENLAALARLGGHGFQSFRGCAFALKAMGRYAAFRARWDAREAARAPRPAVLGKLKAGVLDEAETGRLLTAYEIPLPPGVLVQSEGEALDAAKGMGFPVVLKIQSPDIPHKTEAGGVALHVDEAGLAGAYQRVCANARAHAPTARIEGVLVQKMMPPGHEMVVGVVHDHDFGPLVMLGTGGIYLEILKDVVFAPPPIDRAEALRLIGGLKTAPILKGARGRPPADVEALADLVTRVAEMARAEAPILDQLDLNPVFVYPKGQGVVAVDSLVTIRES